MIMSIRIALLVARLFTLEFANVPRKHIDFDGSEDTFFLDVSGEFDFFGYSYDPAFNSEVVVLGGECWKWNT